MVPHPGIRLWAQLYGSAPRTPACERDSGSAGPGPRRGACRAQLDGSAPRAPPVGPTLWFRGGGARGAVHAGSGGGPARAPSWRRPRLPGCGSGLLCLSLRLRSTRLRWASLIGAYEAWGRGGRFLFGGYYPVPVLLFKRREGSPCRRAGCRTCGAQGKMKCETPRSKI